MKKFIQFSVLTGMVFVLFLSTPSCGLFDKPDNPDTAQTTLGDTLWVHRLAWTDNELWIHAMPLAIGKDGSIYYGASGGQGTWVADRIYAVNKTDGSLKWKSEPLAIWHLNSDIMVGDDGTIYVESYTKLYSIDPATGAFNSVWEVPQTLPYDGHDVNTYGELGGLALANNGNLITKANGSGSYYRAMYCIGADGTMKWYRFIAAENNPISIGYQGTIYDMERDEANNNILTATNPSTGDLIWTMPANSPSGYNNITIADNGDLILHVAQDTIARIDPEDNHFVWETVAVTNYNNKVFSPDGLLYLFDQWAGTSIFNIATGTQVGDPVTVPHSPVIDSKGQLLGALSDYHPYLSVTDNTGTVKWENKMENFYGGGTIAISDENIVYINNGKKVYAIQGDATLAKSGWPKYSHDNRNTFNYSKW